MRTVEYRVIWAFTGVVIAQGTADRIAYQMGQEDGAQFQAWIRHQPRAKLKRFIIERRYDGGEWRRYAG